jgi:hypothetical protein
MDVKIMEGATANSATLDYIDSLESAIFEEPMRLSRLPERFGNLSGCPGELFLCPSSAPLQNANALPGLSQATPCNGSTETRPDDNDIVSLFHETLLNQPPGLQKEGANARQRSTPSLEQL